MVVSRVAAFLFALGLVFNAQCLWAAERMVLSNTEVRTSVFFNANSELVQKLLPAGWVSNPGSGLLKDANAILVLIEGVAAESQDKDKPILYQGKFAVIALPVKNEKTGEAAVMVVGGLVSDPQAAPGAYGVYGTAKINMVRTLRSEDAGPTEVEESWEVSSAEGDKLRFNALYQRGVATRAHVEPKIYAAVKPEFYRIYKVDQVTEIVHSTVDDTKRARKVEVAASGPQFSKLFDGKERLVAVMSIPAYYRQVYLPE
jgi:hypothetical protein